MSHILFILIDILVDGYSMFLLYSVCGRVREGGQCNLERDLIDLSLNLNGICLQLHSVSVVQSLQKRVMPRQRHPRLLKFGLQMVQLDVDIAARC